MTAPFLPLLAAIVALSASAGVLLALAVDAVLRGVA